MVHSIKSSGQIDSKLNCSNCLNYLKGKFSEKVRRDILDKKTRENGPIGLKCGIIRMARFKKKILQVLFKNILLNVKYSIAFLAYSRNWLTQSQFILVWMNLLELNKSRIFTSVLNWFENGLTIWVFAWGPPFLFTLGFNPLPLMWKKILLPTS